MPELKKTKCKECGTEITGRTDKVFCSDYCRNAFHNRENSDTTSFMRNINNTLRKNRRIMDQMNIDGKTRVTKEKLLQAGFNFNYFTNTYVTKTGATYYFCYDQGYLPLEKDSYILVKRQEYMKQK